MHIFYKKTKKQKSKMSKPNDLFIPDSRVGGFRQLCEFNSYIRPQIQNVSPCGFLMLKKREIPLANDK